MMRALIEGERLDAAASSERFRIQKDPARRNLKILADIVPGVRTVRDGRRDVFFFDPEDAFGAERALDDRPSLAAAIAASFGAAFSKVFGGTDYQVQLDGLRAAVVERLAKVRRQHFANIGRKIVVICGREEVLTDKHELLEEVLESVLKQKCVRMQYRNFKGEQKELVVKPYSLAVYDAHLYLIAAKDQDAHPYRFARILDIDVLNDTFPYPEPSEYDPAVLFRDSIGVWASAEPEPCRIRVRLAPSWAVYARHHRWHESQRVAEEAPDGGIVLQFLVRPCPEFEQWVLRFGEAAEVLEPLSLRERIAERLRRAASRYNAPVFATPSQAPP
jgi:predicted DNA-binding transcriptional regulator YafY